MSIGESPPSVPDPEGERDIVPRIARGGRGVSGLAIGMAALLAGVILFSTLDARRRALSAPAVQPAQADLQGFETWPPLYIPPEPSAPDRAAFDEPMPTETSLPAFQYLPSPQPVRAIDPQPYSPPPQPERAVRANGGATLVIDTSPSQREADQASATAAGSGEVINGTASRSRAGSISNRATTVPQGVLIPAVLETAFNSSGPGYARALVQRDVHGFDGTRVLIPRGSRLIGEYGADTSPGQKRALINWTRLIRPDGVTIAIGSPATDPVGTGGVKAKVDSHFLERFSGAFLQSALDIGVNLAARSADRSVVVALPGSIQGTAAPTTATQIPPTLSVRQGTSISVFVARDLDFTDVEPRL